MLAVVGATLGGVKVYSQETTNDCQGRESESAPGGGSSLTKLLSYESKRGRLASYKRISILAIAILFSATAFTWAAAPWSPPVMLSKSAVNAASPSAAVNDSGAMVATWARQVGSIYVVEASVNLNGTWTKAVALSPSGQSATQPDVAIDGNGIATAVWSTGTTIASSSFVNGAWSAPVAVSFVGASASSPRIVADTAGNATAVWIRYQTGGAPVFETADRLAGGNWTSPVVLASVAPQQFRLVTNAFGDRAVVWDIGSFVSSDAVYVSDRQFGGMWSAPWLLASGAYRQGGGRIGIDTNGNLTTCWRTNTVINTADKPAGGNWGPTRALYTNLAVSDYPTMAKTAAGDDMVALITYVSSGSGYNYQIRTAIRPTGGAWGPVTVLTSKNEYDLGLHAGTTPGGTFVLSWLDDNKFQFKSSTRTATTGWSALTVIASGPFDTDLAVADHTAVAVWLGGSFRTTVSTLPVSP